jgi:hypothetical protein
MQKLVPMYDMYAVSLRFFWGLEWLEWLEWLE